MVVTDYGVYQNRFSSTEIHTFSKGPIYSIFTRPLTRFSTFTVEKYPETSILTKEIVLDWCSKKNYEAQANQCARVSILRQLAVYMENVGIGAYILPKGYYPAGQQYVPNIYTEDELQRFFIRQINAAMSVNVHIATSSCRYSFGWFMPVASVPRKQGS